jgi:hypothetical protein
MLPLLAVVLAAAPYLDESKQLISKQQFEPAAERLRLLCPASRDEAVREEACSLLARTESILGHEEKAELLYAALLANDPNLRAPEGPEQAREIFRVAKRKLFSPRFVSLELEDVRTGELQVTVLDPWGLVAELVLLERVEGQLPHETPLSQEDHRASVTTPPRFHFTRYSFEARDARGEQLARTSTIEVPAAVPIAAVRITELVVSSEAPADSRAMWPVWTLSTAAAASATGGLFLALSSAHETSEARESTFASQAIFHSNKAVEADIYSKVLFAGAAAAVSGAVLYWNW